MMDKKIKINKAQCKKCGDIIELSEYEVNMEVVNESR
jgi:hypothetical protein